MKFTATQTKRRIESRELFMHPFTLGFLDGLAGMFDIFGVRARPRHETPEDKAPNLHGETLGVYAKLVPNGADRLMTLVEHEAAHRHGKEPAGTRYIARGQWMAFIVTLALSSGGIGLGLSGHDWLAAALFTTTIGAVVTTLVAGGQSRRKSETRQTP